MKHYFLTKYLSPRGPHNVSVMVLRGYAKTLAAQKEPLGGSVRRTTGPRGEEGSRISEEKQGNPLVILQVEILFVHSFGETKAAEHVLDFE